MHELQLLLLEGVLLCEALPLGIVRSNVLDLVLDVVLLRVMASKVNRLNISRTIRALFFELRCIMLWRVSILVTH